MTVIGRLPSQIVFSGLVKSFPFIGHFSVFGSSVIFDRADSNSFVSTMGEFSPEPPFNKLNTAQDVPTETKYSPKRPNKKVAFCEAINSLTFMFLYSPAPLLELFLPHSI